MKNSRKSRILVLLAGCILHDARVTRHLLALLELDLEILLISFDEQLPKSLRHHRLKQRIWPGFKHAKQISKKRFQKKGHLFYFLKWLSLLYFNSGVALMASRETFDLCLSNDFDTLPAAVELFKRNQIPFIYDSHELYAEQTPGIPAFFKRWVANYEKQYLPQAQKVLTVNESLANELKARHGLSLLPKVILNVPKLDSSHHLGPVQKIPQSVLYHGMFLPERGLESLVKAMKYLPDVTLTLRGQGILEEGLREYVTDQKLCDRVRFEPLVPMEKVIESAAPFELGVIFLEPSCLNNEWGLPNKVFEYLHAGVAILGNEISELRKIIDDTHAGYLIRQLNPETVARAIRLMLEDPAKLKLYQEAALYVAKDRYHFDFEKEKLKTIFQKALNLQPSDSLCAV